jgi:hypothetical protein
MTTADNVRSDRRLVSGVIAILPTTCLRPAWLQPSQTGRRKGDCIATIEQDRNRVDVHAERHGGTEAERQHNPTEGRIAQCCSQRHILAHEYRSTMCRKIVTGYAQIAVAHRDDRRSAKVMFTTSLD